MLSGNGSPELRRLSVGDDDHLVVCIRRCCEEFVHTHEGVTKRYADRGGMRIGKEGVCRSARGASRQCRATGGRRKRNKREMVVVACQVDDPLSTLQRAGERRSPLIPDFHAWRIVEENHRCAGGLTSADGGERAAQCRACKCQNKKDHQQCPEDQKENLLEADPPDGGLLQLLEKPKRAEIDRPQSAQGKKMQHKRDESSGETEQENGIQKRH